MSRALSMLALVIICLVPCSVQAASPAQHAPKHTTPTPGKATVHPHRVKHHTFPQGYTRQNCVVVPKQGLFHISVPLSSVTFVGHGGLYWAGTTICISRATTPCATPGSQGFKVIVNGPMPPLELTKRGVLHKYTPGTGACRKIGSVLTPGLYEALLY